MIKFEALDKNKRPIHLGSMVSFLDTKLKQPVERFGPVDEITFRADGTNVVRVLGYKSKPVPSERVTVVCLSDKESLILEEFTKRGAHLSLDEVKSIACMLSLPEIPVVNPSDNESQPIIEDSNE